MLRPRGEARPDVERDRPEINSHNIYSTNNFHRNVHSPEASLHYHQPTVYNTTTTSHDGLSEQSNHLDSHTIITPNYLTPHINLSQLYTATDTNSLSEYPPVSQPLTAITTHNLSHHLDLSQPQPLTTTSFPSLSQSSPVSGDGLLSAAWGTVGNTGGTNRWEDVTVMAQVGGSSVTDEPWLIQPAGSLEADSSVSGGMRQTDHVREEDSSGMWNVDRSTIVEADLSVISADDEPSAEADMSSGKRPRRQRKMKLYQWPLQQDPQLEKKRLRAVREYQKRQQEEQEEKKLNHQLAETNREIKSLRHQVVSRRKQVDALQQQYLQQQH